MARSSLSISGRNRLLVPQTGVMNVIVTVSRGKEATQMKTFTIDNDNNISVFASKKEAAAASPTPFDPFASHSELLELAAAWPANRLVEIWNSIPGVNAVTKFTNRKIATERIWKAIQSLGGVAQKPVTEASEPVVTDVVRAEPEPAIVEIPANQIVALNPVDGKTTTEQFGLATESKPTLAEPVAHVGAQAAEVTPVAVDTAAAATPKKKAAKAPKKAEAPKATGAREGRKTAQVVAMLQRKNGAPLAEIMETMGWQKHTVRGFMAGAMKKAGYTVESFKPEGGERTYRISQ